MINMKSADHILGVVMGILGIYCFYESYRVWSGWSGSGTMILVIGILFGVVSVLLQLFPSSGSTALVWPERRSIGRIGIMATLFGLYIGLMKWLGYPLATWLFLAAVTKSTVTKSMSKSRIFTTLIWTGLTAVGTYLIFKRYLAMPLPSGFIGF
jgi:hypothetical protein